MATVRVPVRWFETGQLGAACARHDAGATRTLPRRVLVLDWLATVEGALPACGRCAGVRRLRRRAEGSVAAGSVLLVGLAVLRGSRSDLVLALLLAGAALAVRVLGAARDVRVRLADDRRWVTLRGTSESFARAAVRSEEAHAPRG
ncbi:hypothetical protein GCM10027446_25720 [Angustibacter peucedani]